LTSLKTTEEWLEEKSSASFSIRRCKKNAMRKEQMVGTKNAHEKIVFSDLV